MTHRRPASVKGLIAIVLSTLVITLLAPAAGATWSIVGVDSETGDVGVAIASCVPGYALGDLDEPLSLVALVPGVGAGVSQAALNDAAAPEIARLLSDGATSDEVIAALIAESFDTGAPLRQHGVVTVDGAASGFSGTENDSVALDRQAFGVTAQGNILVSDDVVTDALAAFAASDDADLATRLVDALEAGSLAGGDSRCPEQTALFAHVVVARPADDPGAPSTQLIATVDEGSGGNPVELLAEQFRDGTRQGQILLATDDVPILPLVLLGLVILAVAGGGIYLIRRVVRRLGQDN